MPLVRLKGLNKKTRTLADGSSVTYWWAWKGGPRLPGKPGSPAFMAAYAEAVAARRSGPRNDTLAGLVAAYRAAPEFTRLAPGTQAAWRPWLDRIAEADDAKPLAIGGLSHGALDDRRVKAEILAWRDQWADRPRSADYAMQVLSRVLSWGVGRGLLVLNAAAGVGQLYESDRADQVWTRAEEAAYTAAAASPEVGFIVPLACLTGLRRGDLCRLAWSHDGDVAIIMPTGKSRGRKTQVIPKLEETKILLTRIRAQQLARHAELAARAERARRPAPPVPTTILTNTRCRPWTPSGLEHQVIDAKAAAQPQAIDKHLHDARGTFATRLRLAGLKASEIADILGWEEARVERLLKTYVDGDAIVLALAARLNKKEPEE